MPNVKSTASLIFMVFILWSNDHTAQDKKIIRQTLSSAGSSQITTINGKSFTVQQSIGQASSIGTYHTNKNELRQGFIQPLKKVESNTKIEDPINVTIYPNPCSDFVQVDFEENYEDNINLQLFDITGKLISEQSDSFQKKITVDTSNISSGIYLLKIQINNRTITKKINKS